MRWIEVERPKPAGGAGPGTEPGLTWDEFDLAALEAEALLLGIWKNVEELENNISLNELEIILRQARDKEMRHHRFLASLQGIDLDAHMSSGEDRVESAKRRLAAMQAGKSKQEVEFDEFELDYEVEE